MSKALNCNLLIFRVGSLIALTTFLLILLSPASAQTSVTEGSTPSALTPGAPAGSYALSDFENVNLFNGNLNFALPLLHVGGRGGAEFTMMLAIEQHWQIRGQKPTKSCDLTGSCDLRFPWPSWWISMPRDYGPGVLQGRQPGVECPNVTLTRLTFTAPGGTEFELRDQLYNGQPKATQCNLSQGHSRGTVFVTADGSAATFVSDTSIYDSASLAPRVISPSGYLMLRDGTRYRIDEGKVTWIRDRNGNKLTFTYLGSKVSSITDSLNRQVNIAYSVADVAPYGTCDQITFKGFGGAQRTIRVSKTSLANALRMTQPGDSTTTWTFRQLFPELEDSNPTSHHNPTVISSLWLPDGLRRYRFYYNVYSELARVELPTGAAIEYDFDNASNPYDGIYRRVMERRVYPDGTNLESKTTYNGLPGSSVIVDNRDATGTLLARSTHYFHGSPLSSLNQFPTEYSKWNEGREYRTELFASDGTTLLKVNTKTWQQRAPVSWWTGNPDSAPANDPRISETVTTLADTNQVSKQTFGYDDSVPFNNQNNVKEYDFGSGVPGALLRETRTTYLTDSSYTGTSVHLRSLPTRVSIYDGGSIKRAQTTYEYDNYALDGTDCLHSFHCPLAPRPNISGLDSLFGTGYTTRGNATASTRYLLTNGVVTGSVSAYSHYDVAGNVIRAVDPRSTSSNYIVSTIEYDDQFGSPDSEVRSNSVPSELTGFTSFAFPTKVTNPLGHTAHAQFDYYLGRSVNGEDPNGIVAASYFNDLLDRPTQIRQAAGTSSENQITFEYDDTNREITTKNDLDSNGDNLLITKVLYDLMGRTIETRQYEGGTNYIATQTQYDALGRVYRTSNPFRPWQAESASWTTQAFDALNRVVSARTSDNAVISTSYVGNMVTVTDQAGRSRKSVTDALGRLIQVYEDPTGLNQLTSYAYDALDNLTSVTQGTQTRTFLYDSLKRLISATNPESGTITYQYDSNGNLTQKTDARGVISTYQYDVLNRNTTINYSDTATINPDVSRVYDGATNGKGRFWYHYAGGNFSIGHSVEHTAIDSYDVLGRPLVRRQLAKLNGTWGPAYLTSRSYNLAGNVTSQTYPSGHIVSYGYDAAGRTSSFTGNLGEGTNRTYANNIRYSSFGGLTREQFGTNTPLYHKSFYNSRGQLFDTRLSSVNDTWDWNRGRLILYYSSNHLWGQSGTDNNGNVRFAEVSIPPQNATFEQADVLIEDSYNYDSLNRLSSVTEQKMDAAGGWVWQQQFRQAYDYDRWGNRTLNAAGTWLGNANNPPHALLNETQFETADLASSNRLYAPGDLQLPENQRRMRYDAAGNLINDTYTGAGQRVYDAENRMTKAWGGNNQWQEYTYNADGQRTRRKIDGVEMWQVYGFDGELLAEYQANAAAASPRKEYGYRNGQLLVIADAPSRTNVALGATVTASSQYSSNYPASSTINGDRRGVNWNNGGGWNDAAPGNTFPDWLQIDFNGSQTIDEIDVFTLQDSPAAPAEPTESMTFTLYGLTSYEVQYWNGTGWVTVPGGSITSNNKVWRKFTFAPITTSKVRVSINASVDGYSRITEVEAWAAQAAPSRTNFALAGSASASSEYSANYPASSTINGDRRGVNWNTGGGWNDAAPGNTFPDWLQVDFNGSKTIDEIDVFTLQDNPATPAEPTEQMTFALYGLMAYDVQYWTGSTWATVAGGSVSGNNKVWRKFTFTAITTSKIRVVINGTADGYSRITEVEAWGNNTATGAASINWLVTDQLGTPRMIFDETGSLANVKRHDYLPFGEELFAPIGGRITAQGYASGDNVRQRFTLKERDIETGLDYFNARYYASTQGRFTGADPLYIEIRRLSYPQSWNLYSYTRNNPLKYVDDDGLEVKVDCGASDDKSFKPCVEQTTTDLNNRKDAQFKVEIKDGKFGVVGSVDASKLSKSESELYKAITDPKNVSTLKIEMPGMSSASIDFDQYSGAGYNIIDRADMNQLNKVDKSLSGEVIAHAAIEGYVGVAEGLSTYDKAHARANEFFGNVVTTDAVGLPPGAAMSTSAIKTYNFQRVGMSVTMEKRYATPIPAQSVPGNGWYRTQGNLRAVLPQNKDKKP